jgi:hypothetical protein
MVPGDDLLVPLGSAGIGFMAPNTRAVVLLPDFDVGIVGMSLSGTVAPLAGEALVLMLLQLGHLIGVAFFAGLGPGKDRFARLQLREGFSAIPPVLPEGRRGQKIARDAI